MALSLICIMTVNERDAYLRRCKIMKKRNGYDDNDVSDSWIRRHTNIRPATNVVAYCSSDPNAPKIYFWYQHVEN